MVSNAPIGARFTVYLPRRQVSPEPQPISEGVSKIPIAVPRGPPMITFPAAPPTAVPTATRAAVVVALDFAFCASLVALGGFGCALPLACALAQNAKSMPTKSAERIPTDLICERVAIFISKEPWLKSQGVSHCLLGAFFFDHPSITECESRVRPECCRAEKTDQMDAFESCQWRSRAHLVNQRTPRRNG